eukprot:3702572-Rhodomonas_salina.1
MIGNGSTNSQQLQCFPGNWGQHAQPLPIIDLSYSTGFQQLRLSIQGGPPLHPEGQGCSSVGSTRWAQMFSEPCTLITLLS